MALGGASAGNYLRKRGGQFGPQPDENFSPENAYASAIPTQAGNYDEIMQGYRNQMNQGGREYGNIMSRYNSALDKYGQGPTDATYTEAPEMGTAFAKLKELMDTGGLNAQEQGDLRARGISPIRAVYGNMTRNMDRQRALGGGYSPNYNASAARMARESSESIAGATTNVNAKIAEMVQQGKLKAAPEYANLANSKNNLSNQIGVENMKNRTDWMGNYGNLLGGAGSLTTAKNNNNTDALRGMTSLYGTTPALVETFGNQVSNRAGQNQNAAAQKQNYQLGGLSRYARRNGY
jgi:hypothetical protein